MPRVRGEAAGGVQQRRDQAGVQEAGVLTHAVPSPNQPQVALTRSHVDNLEAGPSVERRGVVEAPIGVKQTRSGLRHPSSRFGRGAVAG